MLDVFLQTAVDRNHRKQGEAKLAAALNSLDDHNLGLVVFGHFKLGGNGVDFLGQFKDTNHLDEAVALEQKEMAVEQIISSKLEKGLDVTDDRRDLEDVQLQKKMLSSKLLSERTSDSAALGESLAMPGERSDSPGDITKMSSQFKLALNKVALPAAGVLSTAKNVGSALSKTPGALGKMLAPHLIGAGVGAVGTLASGGDTSDALKAGLLGGVTSAAASGGTAMMAAKTNKNTWGQAANKALIQSGREAATAAGGKSQYNAAIKGTNPAPKVAPAKPQAAAQAQAPAAASPAQQAPKVQPAANTQGAAPTLKSPTAAPAAPAQPAPAAQPAKPATGARPQTPPVAQNGTQLSAGVQAPSPGSTPAAQPQSQPAKQKATPAKSSPSMTSQPPPPAAPVPVPKPSPFTATPSQVGNTQQSPVGTAGPATTPVGPNIGVLQATAQPPKPVVSAPAVAPTPPTPPAPAPPPSQSGAVAAAPTQPSAVANGGVAQATNTVAKPLPFQMPAPPPGSRLAAGLAPTQQAPVTPPAGGVAPTVNMPVSSPATAVATSGARPMASQPGSGASPQEVNYYNSLPAHWKTPMSSSDFAKAHADYMQSRAANSNGALKAASVMFRKAAQELGYA